METIVDWEGSVFNMGHGREHWAEGGKLEAEDFRISKKKFKDAD
jgi:hypothetical protein